MLLAAVFGFVSISRNQPVFRLRCRVCEWMRCVPESKKGPQATIRSLITG